MDYNYNSLVPTINIVCDPPNPYMILFATLPDNDFKILLEEIGNFFSALAINTTQPLASIIDEYRA